MSGARTWAAVWKRGEGRGKRPLRLRTQMKGKTHTAGQDEVGHARADGWMSGARTGGGVNERGTHLGGGAEAGRGTHFEKP